MPLFGIMSLWPNLTVATGASISNFCHLRVFRNLYFGECMRARRGAERP